MASVGRCTRAAIAAVFLALVLPTNPGLGQERSAIPAFPAQADAITVDVVVLDKHGRPVRGLTREDFTLLVDGEPQKIVGFEARELATTSAVSVPKVGEERVATNVDGKGQGRTLVFLIDDLGDDLDRLHFRLLETKKAVAQWLKEKAHPRDELTLVTTSGRHFWSDHVDRGRADFLAVLDRMKGQNSWQPMRGWLAYLARSSGQPTSRPASDPRPPSRAGELAETPVGGEGQSSAAEAPGNPDFTTGITDRIAARTDGTAQERAEELSRKTVGLLGATELLSRGLIGARGRKSIVIFSEGFPNPHEASLLDETVAASQRANTAVYFVDVRGLGARALARAEDKNGAYYDPDGRPEAVQLGLISMYENTVSSSGVEMIAENTGGKSIRDTNDLAGGLERIAEESSAYYLLGYQPEQAPDGKWHKFEVKVARRGVEVRTRRGYQATPPATAVVSSPASKGTARKDRDPKGPKRPMDPAVLTIGRADAVPLRLAPYVLDPDKSGRARVLVVLEVDTSRLTLQDEGGRRTGAIDLTLVGMSRDSAHMFPLDERVGIDLDAAARGGWMSLTREIRLPSGVAQVRALVRDVASGLAGTVTQRLEVPPLDKPYLATPIVTDRMIVGGGQGARLVPVAHRDFRRTGLLYCSYEVVGMTNAKGEATARVAGGFTLRRPDGRMVRQSTPTPIAVALGGKVKRLFILPLADLEAGEYELVLDVVDEATGRTLQSHDTFILG